MGSSQGGLVIIPSTCPAANQQLAPMPEDGEIGVFGAEKYFKMKLDHYDHAANNNRARRLPPDQMTAKSRRGPSSVSSESSWNSQTALITRNRPHSGKGFLSGLSCVGSCNRGKSVRVINDEERSAAAHGNNKPVGFQAAAISLSSTEGYMSPKLRIQSPRAKNMQLQISDHRLSEVQVTTQKDIAVKLEKRLSMLTWDAIPNAPNPMVPTTTRGSQMIIDDVESDGSSDLFEIENLAVGITDHHQVLFAAQESDEMYEPSESSIEWSVVTASVADASVVTDYDHEVRLAGISSGLGRKAAGSKNKPGGGILGCRSLKSVEVAEPAAYTRNGRPRS